MTTDIETIIYAESEVRVSVSNYDDGVFLSLQCSGASNYASLNRKEAEKLLAGLQEILSAGVTA